MSDRPLPARDRPSKEFAIPFPGAGRELARELGSWDAALITIGSVIGTGIFITTSDIARVLPHPGLILLVWLAGGLLTLAGALTFAELGVLFPSAGGIYTYLREAYGTLWGFLFGWTAFLVIMSGGIAALAVAFGEYLGSFFPALGTGNVLLTVPIAGATWTLSAGQLTAVVAIVALSAVNSFGVKQGVGVQNVLTFLKVGAIAVFVVAGFMVDAVETPRLFRTLPQGSLLAAFGVAMIAALWTYDGWYGATFSAGEMRDPRRSLPLGLVGGTLALIGIYLVLNLVYLRALPVEEMANTGRIGETAATALFGDGGGRLLAAAVVVSTFGCLSATILYTSRIYLAMARDGVFFRGLAVVHPRFRTPVRSIWAQSSWAALLALSGTYEQIYTYAVFGFVLFQAATGAGVFVLRRRRPEMPRPYRVWGYPVVPGLFVLASLLLVWNTLSERPLESFLGLGLIALGIPAYLFWRRRSASRPSSHS